MKLFKVPNIKQQQTSKYNTTNIYPMVNPVFNNNPILYILPLASSWTTQ